MHVFESRLTVVSHKAKEELIGNAMMDSKLTQMTEYFTAINALKIK